MSADQCSNRTSGTHNMTKAQPIKFSPPKKLKLPSGFNLLYIGGHVKAMREFRPQ